VERSTYLVSVSFELNRRPFDEVGEASALSACYPSRPELHGGHPRTPVSTRSTTLPVDPCAAFRDVARAIEVVVRDRPTILGEVQRATIERRPN
jgi:hypothetical protein